MGLSVIIPVAERDLAWKGLLPDLNALTAEDEIILSSVHSLKEELRKETEKNSFKCKCIWAPSAAGRARQLNTGTRRATKEFLWFLHCDSRVTARAIGKLRRVIEEDPKAIHFFNLKFLKDGPMLMATNGYGAWFRSRILRLPFGDQGYCLHRNTFTELGGFSESTPYGEDHLIIWKAHQKKIKIRCVGEVLYTSARRYAVSGWAKTTSTHLFLTVWQGTPELARLLRARILP